MRVAQLHVDSNLADSMLYFVCTVPDGIAAPILISQTPSSVLVTWFSPQSSNGVLLQYSVQRTLSGQTDPSGFVIVGTLVPSAATVYQYVDSSSAISPYTSYQYRIGASTLAGTAYGPWALVTTMSSSKS